MPTASNSTPSRPNVIWIFGDQHRAQATGYGGDPNVHTPNLDLLASQGIEVSGAVAGCPLCCPFRGSLLTSRYPHECVPGHEFAMGPQAPTIANAMKEAGYHTAYFGKWHVDGHHERDGRGAMHIVPPERRGGFDEWIGYENNNSPWDSWVHGGRGEAATHYRLPGYETDGLTDLLIGYIFRAFQEAAKGAGTPFFAVLSVQPPHDPYQAPPEFMARHNPAAVVLRPNVPNIPRIVDQARRELAGYYAQIENLDFNVGRVRAALEQVGLTWSTHILFFSDHGDMHGSHGQFRKTTPYEEALRIPLLISGPPSQYPARCGQISIPVNHVDIGPTTLGLCGIDKPHWMRGADYSHRRLKGKAAGPEPDSAFLQLVVPTGHGNSPDRPWRGVVTRDGWKYCVLENIPWMLYNLNEDPYEQANLALNAKFKAERRRLQERLAQWIADTGDKFPLPEV